MFETFATRSFFAATFAAIIVAAAHGGAAMTPPRPADVVQLPTVVISGSRGAANDIVAVVPSEVLQLPQAAARRAARAQSSSIKGPLGATARPTSTAGTPAAISASIRPAAW